MVLFVRVGVAGLAVAAIFMAVVTSAQQSETLSITPVKDGLYYINGVGGNVGVRVTAESGTSLILTIMVTTQEETWASWIPRM